MRISPSFATATPAAVALVLLLVSGPALAQSRDLRGMSALSSPLGPTIGPGYGPPPPIPYGAQSRAPARTDARRDDARESINRSADVRGSSFAMPDLEAEAEQMRSANRASAIEEAISRDPRISAGARQRPSNPKDPAAAVFGSTAGATSGGMTGNIAGNASATGTTTSGARSGGLSGGSVFGSTSGAR